MDEAGISHNIGPRRSHVILVWVLRILSEIALPFPRGTYNLSKDNHYVLGVLQFGDFF